MVIFLHNCTKRKRNIISHCILNNFFYYCWFQCDGCMTLRKGLYTDGMDPDILTYMLEPILESGSCYLRLIRILNEICFAPVSSYIRHFLGLYHRVVLNLPEDLCITSWLYYISPLSHQVCLVYVCFV